MIDLDDLNDLFDDLNDVMPTPQQLLNMHEIYRDDFVHDYVEIDGCKLTLKNQKSWLKGFEGLPETFVHLLTREESFGKPRKFDKSRANKIHWVKQILIQKDDGRIKYFEKIDKGYLKRHYWFKAKKFVVILKPVNPDLLLVTAFHADETKQSDLEYDYNKYLESL